MHKYYLPITALLLAMLMWAPNPAAAKAVAQVIEQNGKPLITLENDWLRLTINPAQGGRVSGCVVKRNNREMVTNPSAGLFMDHFYEQNWPGEFLNAPYEFKVLDAGHDQAVVQVTRMSTGAWGSSVNQGVAKISVIRTLTLPADRPVIECDVELKNTDTASKIFTFWQQNVYRADGDSGAESRQIMTRPSAQGLHVVQPWNDWTRGSDLTAGWTAGVDPKDKVGLAFLMDYNALWSLYNCGLSSSEYFFDKLLLPGGMSWKTHTSAVLVDGLESVAYASPGLVAGIKIFTADGALHVEHTLTAPVTRTKARVTTTLAWLNRSLAIGTQPSMTELSGIGREPQQVKADFPGMAGKPFIIQVNVEGDGWKESYEIPYSGKGTGLEPGVVVDGYTLAGPPKHKVIMRPPVLTKVRNGQPRIMHMRGLYANFAQVEAAADRISGHEMIVSNYKDIGDIKMLSVPPWDYSEIMKLDLLVFNNIAYDAMIGEQGAGMLKAYVESGGSVLFLGGPQAFGRGNYDQSDALKALLPVTLAGPYDLHPQKHGTRLATAPGSPLANIAWGKQPPVALWMHQLVPKPDAQVWLTAGKQAAIVTQQVGKGRVAAVLLTPLGEPAPGDTPYWESPAWVKTMSELMRWLMTK